MKFTFPSGPGSTQLRKGRVSIPGHVYIVTFTTFRRGAWFLDVDLARTACRAFVDRRLWVHSKLLAWVLMPDHWHGLVELGEGDSLSRCVQRLKANSSRRIREAGFTGVRVWQPGFHDRALRRDDELIETARYVVRNPVRAGIVTRIADYPYWDAVWVGN